MRTLEAFEWLMIPNESELGLLSEMGSAAIQLLTHDPLVSFALCNAP